jgi:hypothetical protein
VSILNRLTSRHLDDAAMTELWVTVAGGSSEVATHPHLESCAECRMRFGAFTTWMKGIREDAREDVEAAFPEERFAAQHAQIFKRLEAAERPARVIVFPKFPATVSTRHSPVVRWVATGVAAGLLVGIGLGNLMDLRHIGQQNREVASPVRQAASEPAGRTAAPATAQVSEEALFQQLEAAAKPGYEALRSFDTFTPRAADFLTSSR